MIRKSNRILIVDDDKAIRVLLTRLLQCEYLIETGETGEEALKLAPQFQPGVVLLDIEMPGIDGYETCRRLRAAPYGDAMQIIIVSAKSSRKGQQRAFEAGAHDYIVKPFQPFEMRSRVNLHFRMREALDNLASIQSEIDARNLEVMQLAVARQQNLLATDDTTVFTLAKLAETRDNETGAHLARMRLYSQGLAEQLAEDSPYADKIDLRFLRNLYRSSLLHDIGKVGISDAILLKAGKYTREEFDCMKRHTVIGANILEEAVRKQHIDSFLAMAAEIARFHHERFDGSGYPRGLIGEEIPLSARIVAVADVFDALTSARPYKDAFPTDKAKRMVEEESGKHFDPVIVAAFQKCFDDFLLVPQQVDRMNQAAAESVLLHETKTSDREQASNPEHDPDRKRLDSVMNHIAEQTDETECVPLIDGLAG